MTLLVCPHCDSNGDIRVAETRLGKEGVRRRYHCVCGGRFSTLETVQPVRNLDKVRLRARTLASPWDVLKCSTVNKGETDATTRSH